MKRSQPMKRAYLNRKPMSEEAKAEAKVFRDAILARSHLMSGAFPYICERCEEGVAAIEAHHICSRTRGKGHELLHNPEANGAAFCGHCHHLVTGHYCNDWRKWTRTRSWLDAGGRLAR